MSNPRKGCNIIVQICMLRWIPMLAGCQKAEGLPRCPQILLCFNKLVWSLDKVVECFISYTWWNVFHPQHILHINTYLILKSNFHSIFFHRLRISSFAFRMMVAFEWEVLWTCVYNRTQLTPHVDKADFLRQREKLWGKK